MKRIFVFAIAAMSFAACNNDETTETTVTDSDTTVTNEAVITEQTTTTTKYTPVEGDVTYRNGKVMVWRNNDYVEANEDMKWDNGIEVRRSGEVYRDGKMVRMEEGETVSRTGNWFNSAGDAIEDGWDATKKGVNEAAGAVKKGVNEAGGAIKSAVD